MNYAQRPVTLLGGPALAASATRLRRPSAPRRARGRPPLVVGAVSGLVGGYDDLAGARPEQARDKGLAGHLAALRAGRVSAGAVKVAGIGAAAAVAAAAHPARPRRGRAGRRRADHRPGRRHGEPGQPARPAPRPGRQGRCPAGRHAPSAARPGDWSPARWAPPSPSCPRTWASGSCSATAAPTPSAPCSACGWRRSPAAAPRAGLLAGIVGADPGQREGQLHEGHRGDAGTA